MLGVRYVARSTLFITTLIWIGMRVIYNPAPINDATIQSLEHSWVSILVVNQHEAVQLASYLPASILAIPRSSPENEYQVAFDALTHKFPQMTMIVTLGEQGCYVYEPATPSELKSGGLSVTSRYHVPSFHVDHVVDSTAAGDTFIGNLAAHLAHGLALEQAVRHATVAAAVSVTRRGALDSCPSMSEYRHLMNADVRLIRHL